MKKKCENCIHSYYEDLYYELCCDKNKRYIGELHAEERAKNFEHYEKEPLLNKPTKGWKK